MHTAHTSKSQSRSGSHLSHQENARAMQLEIDHLKRKLHHKQQKPLPPILTSLLTMRRMVVIDPDQKLLPVSLSRMMRTTTISVETRTHLSKALEMMQ